MSKKSPGPSRPSQGESETRAQDFKPATRSPEWIKENARRAVELFTKLCGAQSGQEQIFTKNWGDFTAIRANLLAFDGSYKAEIDGHRGMRVRFHYPKSINPKHEEFNIPALTDPDNFSRNEQALNELKSKFDKEGIIIKIA